MQFYQLRSVLVKTAEIFNCQGYAKGLLNLVVAYAEVLLISFPPPKPPRKICSWDSLCAPEWLTDTEVAVAWVSDASPSMERPQSQGLEWGWVPAESLRSRCPAFRWSWSYMAWSPGRWYCDHGDDPTDLQRRSRSAVEPESAGHACPYQDSQNHICKISMLCNTPILRAKKEMSIFRGPLICLSSY